MTKCIIHGLKNEMCYSSILKKMICVSVLWVAAHVPRDSREGRGPMCVPRANAIPDTSWDAQTLGWERKKGGEQEEKIKIKVLKV